MKLYCYISVFSLLICGCIHQRPSSQSNLRVSTSQQKQINYLVKSKVQILKVGDELRLILPNDRFFVSNTPNLKRTSYPALSEIVSLLNQKKNFGISVLGYTPSLEHFTPNISLAQQQSQAIVDYLQDHGLNARLVISYAWDGVSDRQKFGTGSFNDDPPTIFSVEIRTRLLHAEDIQ